MHFSSLPPLQGMTCANYFEKCGAWCDRQRQRKNNNNDTSGATSVAPLKADEAVMPRVDFVSNKSNWILSPVLFSARLPRPTLAACRSRTDGWWHLSSALLFFCVCVCVCVWAGASRKNTTVPLWSVLWFGNDADSCGALRLHQRSIVPLLCCRSGPRHLTHKSTSVE